MLHLLPTIGDDSTFPVDYTITTGFINIFLPVEVLYVHFFVFIERVRRLYKSRTIGKQQYLPMVLFIFSGCQKCSPEHFLFWRALIRCLLLSFFQFLADPVVLFFIQLVVLLIENIRHDHTGSRHDGHEQKKFHDFSVGGAVHHIADGGKLV